MTPRPPRGRALLVALVSVLCTATAFADNPFDAQQRQLAAEAARTRGPEGILPILELWQGWDEATPTLSLELLDGLSRNRRLPVERRAYVDILRARARYRRGDLDGSRELTEQLGFVTDWQVVGPFDNEGKQGFARADGPEAARMEAWEAGMTWRGKERAVGWRRYPPNLSHFGYVNFDALMRPFQNVCGYAQTTVHSERAQPLSLWVGGGAAIKVWWNGEEVHVDEAYRFPDPDRHAVAVGAHEGANRLLVKTCVTDTAWGFFLRVAAANGTPAEGIRVDAESIPMAAGAGHGANLPRRPPQAHLARLEAATEGNRVSADDRYDLARFLSWTGADDPAELQARQLAGRAAEEAPTVEHVLLAARLSEQRSEIMRHLQRVPESDASHPELLLLQAQVISRGLHPEEALALLDQVDAATEDDSVEGMEAAVLRAALLQDMDMPHAARAVVERAAAHAPGAPGWLRSRAEMAQAAGHRDEAIRLRQQLAEVRYDDAGTRRVLIADAVRRRETDRAAQHLEALRQAQPDSARTLRYLAGIYEALGQTDEAMDALASARQMAPEDATSIVAHAQLMLRMDQRDAAIDAFRQALALRPQDAETRELLEQIQPQERPDERYAAEAEALLARAGDSEGFPTSTLQNLTVNTVYTNGLGSSFRQIAVQVHDDEGARRWRTYSIPYDPGSQRVDVRLARIHRGGTTLEATQMYEQPMGEPWYRIYYDTRARIIVFPDLEPGDVVELRWRVDDVAHRNLFADYYGDLTFLQGFDPMKHFEYVLITPSEREFFFNDPGLEGLQRTTEEEGDTRIHRFVANDVPAIRSEPGMPGMTEIAPYLHVSTYGAWEDVGRWYWGLIQDQLYADDELQRTVAELVRGKETTREKVVAIHDWVVEHTRYVGLEFGIHGFKPYRVPQIVRRGFGDCKDKASLLFTMFREAGIDAHIILVRTRRNGQIRDLPASLAVFDHAIAYVPELDLYIDGTAEHSGIAEIPQMDQGVTVLHVWPEGSELRRTPVMPPDHNRRERELDVRLAADGSAEIRGREVVTGNEAPGYRATYQAEGTRDERFERAMRGIFPGLDLQRQEFRNLDTLERPVEYEYTAEVPQLAQRDGTALRMPPTVLQDLVRSMARSPERRYPLDLGGTASYQEQRTVRLPGGFRPGDMPSGGTVESPFGRLQLTVEASGRQVQTRTEFELRQDRVSPEDYPAFRRWVQEADQVLRQRITLEGQ